MCTVKKYKKSLNVNIFVRIPFKNKTKKWNSIFTIISVPCKFQQNVSQKMALGTNRLNAKKMYEYEITCIFYTREFQGDLTVEFRRNGDGSS
jgi:hypothetical protein